MGKMLNCRRCPDCGGRMTKNSGKNFVPWVNAAWYCPQCIPPFKTFFTAAEQEQLTWIEMERLMPERIAASRRDARHCEGIPHSLVRIQEVELAMVAAERQGWYE